MSENVQSIISNSAQCPIENTSHFLAYIAGLFDGEGTCCIGRNKTAKGSVRYILRVAIVNTYPQPLMILKETFGGSFITKKAGLWKVKGQKQGYVWDISGRQALKFLVQILPYLWIKKEQANLAIKFQARFKTFGNKGGVSKTELAERELIAQEMSNLNHTSYTIG